MSSPPTELIRRKLSSYIFKLILFGDDVSSFGEETELVQAQTELIRSRTELIRRMSLFGGMPDLIRR